MAELIRIVLARWIVWGADICSEQFRQRWPRTSRVYEFTGRCAAVGFLVLIALTLFVFIPIGFVSWLVTS